MNSIGNKIYDGYDMMSNPVTLKFEKSIQKMVDHAQTTAEQTVAISKNKSTEVAEPGYHPKTKIYHTPIIIVPAIGRVRYRSYDFGRSYGPTIINNHTTVINNNNHIVRPHRDVRGNKDDGKLSTEARLAIGAVAIVALGYAAYRGGEEYRHFTDAQSEKSTIKSNIKKIDKLQKEFVKGSEGNKSNPHLKSIDKILKLEKGIFSRIQKHCLVKVAIMVGFAAAATLGVIAALTGLTAFAIAGAATGIAVGAGTLFYIGFSNIKKANAKDGEAILKQINHLQKIAMDSGKKAPELPKIPEDKESFLDEKCEKEFQWVYPKLTSNYDEKYHGDYSDYINRLSDAQREDQKKIG